MKLRFFRNVSLPLLLSIVAAAVCSAAPANDECAFSTKSDCNKNKSKCKWLSDGPFKKSCRRKLNNGLVPEGCAKKLTVSMDGDPESDNFSCEQCKKKFILEREEGTNYGRCVEPTAEPSASSYPSQAPTREVYHTVIVGAGAAGLAAGHTLVNRCRHSRRCDAVDASDIKILEAQSIFGGRFKKDDSLYSEFSLEMGASFIQYPKQIKNILCDQGKYSGIYEDSSYGTFSNYSYWHFFDDYVVPPIRSSIEYDCVVDSVSYDDGSEEDSVILTTCSNGRSFLSRYVVVTVPWPILRDGVIAFDPPLPDKITVKHPTSRGNGYWKGFKAYMEFKNPDELPTAYGGFASNSWCNYEIGTCYSKDGGENLFWDYTAVNQPGLENGNMLLAGYVLGPQSEPFIGMSDEEIFSELVDTMAIDFKDGTADGDARANKIKKNFDRGTIIENWGEKPLFNGTFSRESYSCPGGKRYCKNNPVGAVDPAAIDEASGWEEGKIFVAGEAFSVDGSQGWVDAGAWSGDDAANKILEIDQDLRRPKIDSFWKRVKKTVQC